MASTFQPKLSLELKKKQSRQVGQKEDARPPSALQVGTKASRAPGMERTTAPGRAPSPYPSASPTTPLLRAEAQISGSAQKG